MYFFVYLIGLIKFLLGRISTKNFNCVVICPWQIYGRFVVLSGFVTSPKRKNKEGECYIDGCRVYVDYI